MIFKGMLDLRHMIDGFKLFNDIYLAFPFFFLFLLSFMTSLGSKYSLFVVVVVVVG